MTDVSDVETEQTQKAGMLFHRLRTTRGIHPYDEIEWKKFDAEIPGSDFKQKGVEFPASWSQDSVNIVASKYFYTWDDAGREFSLKQLIDRVIDTITEAGAKAGYFETKKDQRVFNVELKWLAVNQYFAFNSPVWFNIGTPERQQASACFINAVEDDMDSIMRLAHDEANIFKLGSGAGVNLSPIRARNETLTGGGEASGPVSFMKGFDAFAGVIKSGGKNRRAAKMIILNDDHPDIEEFIWCKSKEEKKAVDLIQAGYNPQFDAEDGAYASVFYQNANHSVRVTDAFMGAVKNDEDYDLIRRTDGEVMKTVSARDIMQQIAQATWECGDPGMQYDDTIHTWHTCKNSGRQVGSNPCSEYLFLNNTACNLASLNLMMFRDGEEFAADEFRHAIQLIITAQDILVDHADYPTARIDKGTRRWRTLGLGYANLGALLMSWGLPYDSEEGRNLAASITSLMGGEAYRTSALLAQALTPFEGFKANAVPMLEVTEKHRDAAHDIPDTPQLSNKEGQKAWMHADILGGKYGYRNAQVTVLAPTGTISFMMGCDTTGGEPAISLVSYKQLVGGGMIKHVNRIVRIALRELGYGPVEVDKICAHVEEHGTIENARRLQDKHLPVFDCAITPANGQRSISWKGHIDMMAAIQPFLSGAISKTVNMPNTATPGDIENAYIYAWEEGIKALALYRDGCKSSQPLSTTDESETKDDVPAKVVRRRKKLPATRPAINHKFKVGGQKGYLTVGLYEDGMPGEIFVTMNKEGSTIAGLLDSFATAISIGMQYGAPLEDLVSKFKHSNFEPAGFTPNPEIRTASSIVDYLFKWLELEFLPKSTGVDSVEGEAATVVFSPTTTADAPLCANCGNPTQRSGACYSCTRCGETTGCG